MKTLLTTIIFLHSIGAYTQVRFNNLSSKKPDETILYVGAENKIEVKGAAIGVHKYVIRSTSGEVSQYEGFCIVNIQSEGYDTLRLYEDGKLKLQQVFSKMGIPAPVARLANSSDTALTKTQIKFNPFLSVVWLNSNYFDKCLVRNFTVKAIDPLGHTIFFENINGHLLSKELLSAIEKLDHNSKLIFDEIIAVCASCKPRLLAPLIITIKLR